MRTLQGPLAFTNWHKAQIHVVRQLMDTMLGQVDTFSAGFQPQALLVDSNIKELWNFFGTYEYEIDQQNSLIEDNLSALVDIAKPCFVISPLSARQISVYYPQILNVLYTNINELSPDQTIQIKTVLHQSAHYGAIEFKFKLSPELHVYLKQLHMQSNGNSHLVANDLIRLADRLQETATPPQNNSLGSRLKLFWGDATVVEYPKVPTLNLQPDGASCGPAALASLCHADEQSATEIFQEIFQDGSIDYKQRVLQLRHNQLLQSAYQKYQLALLDGFTEDAAKEKAKAHLQLLLMSHDKKAIQRRIAADLATQQKLSMSTVPIGENEKQKQIAPEIALITPQPQGVLFRDVKVTITDSLNKFSEQDQLQQLRPFKSEHGKKLLQKTVVSTMNATLEEKLSLQFNSTERLIVELKPESGIESSENCLKLSEDDISKDKESLIKLLDNNTYITNIFFVNEELCSDKDFLAKLKAIAARNRLAKLLKQPLDPKNQKLNMWEQVLYAHTQNFVGKIHASTTLRYFASDYGLQFDSIYGPEPDSKVKIVGDINKCLVEMGRQGMQAFFKVSQQAGSYREINFNQFDVHFIKDDPYILEIGHQLTQYFIDELQKFLNNGENPGVTKIIIYDIENNRDMSKEERLALQQSLRGLLSSAADTEIKALEIKIPSISYGARFSFGFQQLIREIDILELQKKILENQEYLRELANRYSREIDLIFTRKLTLIQSDRHEFLDNSIKELLKDCIAKVKTKSELKHGLFLLGLDVSLEVIGELVDATVNEIRAYNNSSDQTALKIFRQFLQDNNLYLSKREQNIEYESGSFIALNFEQLIDLDLTKLTFTDELRQKNLQEQLSIDLDFSYNHSLTENIGDNKCMKEKRRQRVDQLLSASRQKVTRSFLIVPTSTVSVKKDGKQRQWKRHRPKLVVQQVQQQEVTETEEIQQQIQQRQEMIAERQARQRDSMTPFTDCNDSFIIKPDFKLASSENKALAQFLQFSGVFQQEYLDEYWTKWFGDGFAKLSDSSPLKIYGLTQAAISNLLQLDNLMSGGLDWDNPPQGMYFIRLPQGLVLDYDMIRASQRKNLTPLTLANINRSNTVFNLNNKGDISQFGVPANFRYKIINFTTVNPLVCNSNRNTPWGYGFQVMTSQPALDNLPTLTNSAYVFVPATRKNEAALYFVDRSNEPPKIMKFSDLTSCSIQELIKKIYPISADSYVDIPMLAFNQLEIIHASTGHNPLLDEKMTLLAEVVHYDTVQFLSDKANWLKAQAILKCTDDQLRKYIAEQDPQDASYWYKIIFPGERYQSIIHKLQDKSSDPAGNILQCLFNYGGLGLKLILDMLLALEIDLGLNFDFVFEKMIKGRNSLSTFFNANNIQALQRIQQYNEFEREWFFSLLKNHLITNQNVEIEDCIPWFNYFLERLSVLGVTLASVPKFQDELSMPVQLDRILALLENAVDPNEQMKLLNGLEFGLQDAFLAVRQDNFLLVTKEMQLSFQYEQQVQPEDLDFIVIESVNNPSMTPPSVPDTQQQPLSYKVENLFRLKQFQLKHPRFDRYKVDFFRYLGGQLYISNYSYYVTIVDKIAGKNLSGKNKNNLLVLLASALTGQRGFKFKPQQVDAFLIALENVSEERLTPVLASLSQWVTTIDCQPKIDELSALLSLLINTDIPDLNIFVEDRLRPLINAYNESAWYALALLQKNNAVRQSQPLTVAEVIAYFNQITQAENFNSDFSQFVLISLCALQREAISSEMITELTGLMNQKPQQSLALFKYLSFIDFSVQNFDITEPSNQLTFSKIILMLRDLDDNSNISQLVKTQCQCYFNTAGHDIGLDCNLLKMFEKFRADLTELVNIPSSIQQLDKVIQASKELLLHMDNGDINGVLVSFSAILPELVRLRGIANMAACVDPSIKPVVKSLDEVIQFDKNAPDAIIGLLISDHITHHSFDDASRAKLKEALKQKICQGWTLKTFAVSYTQVELLIKSLQKIGRTSSEVNDLVAMFCDQNILTAQGASIGLVANLMNAAAQSLKKSDSEATPIPFLYQILKGYKRATSNQALDEILVQYFSQIIGQTQSDYVKTLQLNFILRLVNIPNIDAADLNELLVKLSEIQNYNNLYQAIITQWIDVDFNILLNFIHVVDRLCKVKNQALQAMVKPDLIANVLRVGFTPALLVDIFNLLMDDSEGSATTGKGSERLNAILFILSRASVKDQGLLRITQLLLDIDAEKLLSVKALFQYKPSPTIAWLQEFLLSPDRQEELSKNFDFDPYGNRLHYLAQQYDTSRVEYALELIEANVHLSALELDGLKAKLRYQFQFINGIGRNFPIEVGYAAVSHLSRDEIHELLLQYNQQLRNSLLDAKVKIQIQLKCLALAREAMYRTTGKFPYSTQLLSLLYALNANDARLIAGIPTGQGKTLICAMYAFMQAIEGKTVDVCTSNYLLAEEGYNESKDFLKYLGIATAYIPSGAANGTYQCYSQKSSEVQIGAVNYSDVSNMALYDTQARFGTETMPNVNDRCLITDEVDYTIFDNPTEYRLSKPMGDNLDPYYNPVAELYPILIKFLIKHPIGKLRDKKNKQNVFDAFVGNASAGIASYIDRQKPGLLSTIQQVYGMEWENQIDIWLDSALTALDFKINQDFVVEKTTRDEYGHDVSRHFARIITPTGAIDGSASWGQGVQQCLHARLNLALDNVYDDSASTHEEDGKFPYDPELSSLSVLTCKDFCKSYGHIFGVTGTPGTSEGEFRELALQYGFHSIYSMPSHRPNQRLDLPIRFAANEKNHKKYILQDLIQERNDDSCGLLLSATSPLGQDYKFNRPTYILSPEGLYYVSDFSKPVTSNAFIESSATRINELRTRLSIEGQQRDPACPISRKNQDIITSVTGHAPKQPVLLLCKNPKAARELEAWLQLQQEISGCTIQLITGEESSEKRKQLLEKSGQANTITVSTKVSGRGTDFKPHSKHGLFTIQTYFDQGRPTGQGIGRAGRNGDEGKSRVIVDLSELRQDYPKRWRTQDFVNQNRRLQKLRDVKDESQREARRLRDGVGDSRYEIQTEFLNWLQEFRKTPDATSNPFMDKQVFVRYQRLVDELEKLVDEDLSPILDADDPFAEITAKMMREWQCCKDDLLTITGHPFIESHKSDPVFPVQTNIHVFNPSDLIISLPKQTSVKHSYEYFDQSRGFWRNLIDWWKGEGPYPIITKIWRIFSGDSRQSSTVVATTRPLAFHLDYDVDQAMRNDTSPRLYEMPNLVRSYGAKDLHAIQVSELIAHGYQPIHTEMTENFWLRFKLGRNTRYISNALFHVYQHSKTGEYVIQFKPMGVDDLPDALSKLRNYLGNHLEIQNARLLFDINQGGHWVTAIGKYNNGQTNFVIHDPVSWINSHSHKAIKKVLHENYPESRPVSHYHNRSELDATHYLLQIKRDIFADSQQRIDGMMMSGKNVLLDQHRLAEFFNVSVTSATAALKVEALRDYNHIQGCRLPIKPELLDQWLDRAENAEEKSQVRTQKIIYNDRNPLIPEYVQSLRSLLASLESRKTAANGARFFRARKVELYGVKHSCFSEAVERFIMELNSTPFITPREFRQLTVAFFQRCRLDKAINRQTGVGFGDTKIIDDLKQLTLNTAMRKVVYPHRIIEEVVRDGSLSSPRSISQHSSEDEGVLADHAHLLENSVFNHINGAEQPTALTHVSPPTVVVN